MKNFSLICCAKRFNPFSYWIKLDVVSIGRMHRGYGLRSDLEVVGRESCGVNKTSDIERSISLRDNGEPSEVRLSGDNDCTCVKPQNTAFSGVFHSFTCFILYSGRIRVTSANTTHDSRNIVAVDFTASDIDFSI